MKENIAKETIVRFLQYAGPYIRCDNKAKIAIIMGVKRSIGCTLEEAKDLVDKYLRIKSS